MMTEAEVVTLLCVGILWSAAVFVWGAHVGMKRVGVRMRQDVEAFKAEWKRLS